MRVIEFVKVHQFEYRVIQDRLDIGQLMGKSPHPWRFSISYHVDIDDFDFTADDLCQIAAKLDELNGDE